MNGIRVILLDVDGTVLDTSEFVFQAVEYALQNGGYAPIPRSKISEGMGMSFKTFYASLLNDTELDSTGLQAAHRAFQLDNLNLSASFPHSIETLSELKKRGYKLAAVTNRFRVTLMPTLDSADLTKFFDEIVAADDSPELKPSGVHPEVALTAFGVSPSEAVMVGDTDIDIQAGRAAGIKTVRALYGHHFNSETETKADFYIKDVKELLDLFP